VPRVQKFHVVTATTTLAQLIPYNKKRVGILLKVMSGQPCYVSNDQTDVAATGFPLAVGEYLSLMSRDGDVPELALYGLTLLATTNVRIIETFGEPEL
jgi:hypothetical protein